MAYTQIKYDAQKNGYTPDRKSAFVMDSKEDLNTLPECEPGSVAYTANMNFFAVMSPSNGWQKVIDK